VTLPLSCGVILAPALAMASSLFICALNASALSCFCFFWASLRASSTQSMKSGQHGSTSGADADAGEDDDVPVKVEPETEVEPDIAIAERPRVVRRVEAEDAVADAEADD
jgi:hypothetical protein